MSNAVEGLATIIILILVMVFVAHLINGTAIAWLKSKFTVFQPQ